jgi:hypothetical protein
MDIFRLYGKIFKGRQILEGSPGRTKTNFKKLKHDEKLSKKMQSNDTKHVVIGENFEKNYKLKIGSTGDNAQKLQTRFPAELKDVEKN